MVVIGLGGGGLGWVVGCGESVTGSVWRDGCVRRERGIDKGATKKTLSYSWLLWKWWILSGSKFCSKIYVLIRARACERERCLFNLKNISRAV
jgi:hypothetical protein